MALASADPSTVCVLVVCLVGLVAAWQFSSQNFTLGVFCGKSEEGGVMRGLSYMRLQQVRIHNIHILMSFCGHYHDTVAIAVTSREFNWCSTTVVADRYHFGKVSVTELCGS